MSVSVYVEVLSTTPNDKKALWCPGERRYVCERCSVLTVIGHEAKVK